jgi:hypothetical protein
MIKRPRRFLDDFCQVREPGALGIGVGGQVFKNISLLCDQYDAVATHQPSVQE